MNFKSLGSLALVLLLAIGSANAQQNTMLATTTSQAITGVASCPNTFNVTATTSMTARAPQTSLYIDNESMTLIAVNSATSITVARAQNGTTCQDHVTGAVVLYGRPGWFYKAPPALRQACTASTVFITPWVDIKTGYQYLCGLAGFWVPGWNNPGVNYPTAAVASVAGVIVPTGPLQHMTGTNAITGITLPLGYAGGPICFIADGIWTWTAAGNIATAGTTTAAGRTHCFSYDPSAAKPFYPDKVI